MSLQTALMRMDTWRHRFDLRRPHSWSGGITAHKAFSLSRHHHPPLPDRDEPADSGYFFYYRERVFRPGRYVLRCHIQVAEGAFETPGGELSIECIDPALTGPEGILARLSQKTGPKLIAWGDHLFLKFTVSKTTRLDIRGHVTRGLGQVHLRYLVAHAPKPGETIDYTRIPAELATWPKQRLRGLMIGTNGQCNASCATCPTNKVLREHLPTGVMTMDMFRQIIDGIADGDIELEKNKLGLGLFGEPLMDPHIVERVRYAKLRLPSVRILLNTNAGPFNERRHAELAKLVHRFSVHVEALSPSLYAEMMSPLRAEVVFPRIERLIALAPKKVSIAVPVSKRNLHEFPELRKYWLEKGARNVAALQLSNRTTDTLDYYGQSLGPTPTACSAAVGFDLVIDWDGTVLGCCQDFMKREVLGNLNGRTVSEVLADRRRQRFIDKIQCGEWNALKSCKDCKRDLAIPNAGDEDD